MSIEEDASELKRDMTNNKKKKKVVRAKDFMMFPATNFGVRLNDNLCELHFAYETAEDGENIILEQARVIMTPRSLKTLWQFLSELLPPFEAKSGEIVLTQKKIEQLKKAVADAGLVKMKESTN